MPDPWSVAVMIGLLWRRRRRSRCGLWDVLREIVRGRTLVALERERRRTAVELLDHSREASHG